MQSRYDKLTVIMRSNTCPVPVVPPPYQRKFPALPILPTYKGDFPKDYWLHWPEDKTLTPKSWISTEALLEISNTLGYSESEKLRKELDILSRGADLGVSAEGRVQWAGENYSSVFEYGHLVSDTLCKWVDQKVVSGPWDPNEVLGKIPLIRIHPMSCQLKPTGARRVIINMSAPRRIDIASINSTIDLDSFPVEMCSCHSVVDMLTEVGFCPDIVGAKYDWAHAYKHVPISLEDAGLQWIRWGGKLFIDLSLVFGASTSPSLYHAVAIVILELSRIMAGTNPSRTKNQLDDTFTIDRLQSAWAWFRAYEYVAEFVCVKLADKSKLDKVCPPSKLITLLGIEYDLSSWSWRMPPEKASKLLSNLYDVFSHEKVTVSLMLKVSGKLSHYCAVVGGKAGRFERSFVLYATS